MSELHKFTPSFNDEDVIQFNSQSLTRFETIKGILLRAMPDRINQLIREIFKENKVEVNGCWVSKEGLNCQVLRIGSQGWQKGKIRIKFEIEFIPDEPEITEPESPLDDIRREINQT